MERRRSTHSILAVAALLGSRSPPGTLQAGQRYRIEPEPGTELAAGEVLYTVPWDPEADGKHVRGRVVRIVLRAAELALAEGWSAEGLRQRPHWHEQSLRAACVRQSGQMGARKVTLARRRDLSDV